MKAFKEFEFDRSELTENEAQVVDKLVEAGKIVASLYEEQKETGYYPENISREVIEEAAEKDNSLLHPYSFVETTKKGDLRGVYYTSRFKKKLKEASGLIQSAAKVTEDKEFATYLKEMASALLKNDYAINEKLWVTNTQSRFSFIIGPVERYLDKLFFKKCAYHGWLGLINDNATEEAKKFRDIILAGRRKILPDTFKVKLPALRVDINKTIYFAGLIADNMFTGTNLPNDVTLMEEDGSKLTIFQSSLNQIFETKTFPIFNKIFNQKSQDRFDRDELKSGLLRLVLLHEISHSLVRYKDADQRLGDLFPIFDELLAYILGIRSCDSLLLKDVLEQRDVEAIMAVYVARCFRYWNDAKTNPNRSQYAKGCTVAINFFLEDGALKNTKGCLSIDFRKLYISVDRLSRMVEYHLASGTHEEAAEFLEKYGSEEAFKNCPIE